MSPVSANKRPARKTLLQRLGSIRSLAGAMMLFVVASPAFADDIAGKWALETSNFDNNCKIVGSFNFTATAVKNTYSCEFVSEQICGDAKKPDLYIKVKQSCTAQRVGRQVAIKSKVVSVVDRKPQIPAPELSYYADNFILTLQKNMAEMLGGHYDEQRNLKARFWREEALIS